MVQLFLYQNGIPARVALAVIRIIQNKRVESSWQTLRDQDGDVFEYIESIIVDNGCQGSLGDIGWWRAKIIGN